MDKVKKWNIDRWLGIFLRSFVFWLCWWMFMSAFIKSAWIFLTFIPGLFIFNVIEIIFFREEHNETKN